MAKKYTTKKKSSETAEDEVTLDDVMVELQKSFSRVSAKSRNVPSEDARALIVGEVDFEISLPIEPEKERILQKKESPISLTLRGTINTDIRASENNSENND